VQGATVTYTLAITNTGAVAYTTADPATFTDNLSQVLDDAAYNNDATNGAVFTSPVLAWRGALAVGATEIITYSVTVNTPDTGDHLLENSVVTPTGLCSAGSTNPSCRVVVPVKSYAVVKRANATAALPGKVVSYSITVTNTGQVAFGATDVASFSDDLTNVLKNASYNEDANHGATYAAPKLSWSGLLPVGATTTVTYSVTLNQGAPTGTVLHNVVTTPSDPAGTVSNCLSPSSDPSCVADVTIAAVSVTPPVTPALPHEIAFTGANVVPLLGGGIALLVTGMAFLFGRTIRRRRRDLN
jgi:uncharacterized repeat protein (TIGR01451 family)